MNAALLHQELLDEQFIQLEELEAEGSPNFVEEVFTLYSRDSTKTLESIGQMLYVLRSSITSHSSFLMSFKLHLKY